MAAKSCTRMPKGNVFWKDIPPGTQITDCGRYWVAKVAKGPAVVYWDGATARTAQTRLHAAARRGRW